MNCSNKYQPYQGYDKKPWLGYGLPGYGRRIRTCGDWHYDCRPSQYYLSKYPMGVRPDGQRWGFWQRSSDNGGSVYEKRLAHRMFRRWAKRAIQRELAGEEISHTFRYCGNWLD